MAMSSANDVANADLSIRISMKPSVDYEQVD
eukprot:SAG31_NODE_2570_length_5460_cov_3.135236_1_plen_31_part_10